MSDETTVGFFAAAAAGAALVGEVARMASPMSAAIAVSSAVRLMVRCLVVVFMIGVSFSR